MAGMQPEKFVLYPDAGAVQNEQVLLAYLGLLEEDFLPDTCLCLYYINDFLVSILRVFHISSKYLKQIQGTFAPFSCYLLNFRLRSLGGVKVRSPMMTSTTSCRGVARWMRFLRFR